MLSPGSAEHWAALAAQQNVEHGLAAPGVTPGGQPGVPPGVVAHIGDLGARRTIARVENVDTATLLDLSQGERVLVWRPGRYQRVFRVPPVPALEGLTLEGLQLQLALRAEQVKDVAREAMALRDAQGLDLAAVTHLEQRHRETTAAALDVAQRAVVLFHELVRPTRWLERWTWRWLSNPFQNASEGEISELLAFFSACRMGLPAHPGRNSTMGGTPR